MKKVIFATLMLAVGLWSCSDSDNNDGTEDGYVDVTIGTESGGLKSIVSPGGATSWNIGDQVIVVDVDGTAQQFLYAAETPKSSAEFAGKLRAGQGKKVYKAYHTPTKSKMTLKSGHILVVEREDIEITEDESISTSVMFGSYCPMVATPFEFDAEDKNASKLAQFYHLGAMIEGRIALRDPEDQFYFERTFDKIVFEVEALGSNPFYKQIELDMDQLTTSSRVEDLNDCIINQGNTSVKTNIMSTTMNMEERSIGDLVKEYKLFGYFAIPIFALPTSDAFDYKATIRFFYYGDEVLKLEGEAKATGLNPAGLNILNFDHKKIVE